MLSVDPALAMYPGISPYIFVLNNPVRYVDPTGMFVEPPTKSGSYEGQTHYDPDTGATYEWDGQGNWHSDMGGIQELDDVVITGNGSSSPDYVSSSIIAIGAYNNFKEYTQYNEYLEIWKGKNGKMYEGLKGRGPNQYTGSRGFAKSKAANFGKVGNVLSILSIGQTELEFQYNMNNNPGPNLKKYLKDKRLRDQSFNGVGFLGQFGAAASFGYNLGYLIESICNCNIQLNPFTLDFTPIEQTLTEFDNIGIYLYTD